MTDDELQQLRREATNWMEYALAEGRDGDRLWDFCQRVLNLINEYDKTKRLRQTDADGSGRVPGQA